MDTYPNFENAPSFGVFSFALKLYPLSFSYFLFEDCENINSLSFQSCLQSLFLSVALFQLLFFAEDLITYIFKVLFQK